MECLFEEENLNIPDNDRDGEKHTARVQTCGIRMIIVTLPHTDLTKKAFPDPPQLSVCEEEVPTEQLERSPSLGQEEPEPLQIKEEQEELWISQEGEQLQGLQEADIIKLTSTPVTVKSEHDEEKPQSSWFNQTQTEENREAEPLASTSTEQMKTEPDGEDCGVSEPASNLEPAGDLKPTGDGRLLSSDCSGTETDDSDEWEETGEPQSGLNTLKSKKTQKHKGQSLCISNKFKSSVGSSHEVKLSNQILSETWSCKVCGKCCYSRASLGCHVRFHLRDCGLCGKHLEPTESLQLHLEAHRTCTVCGKKFTRATDLDRHMISHTGEKPYSCALCHKRFVQRGHLNIHLRCHTREKPFSCTVCGKGFARKEHVERHVRIHTGEKPHSFLSLPLDPPQLSVCEEEVPPEQQERGPSLGQEEPEPLQIKEEQEELWTSKEGEQLQGLEEADIIKFTLNPVPVKSEHDEEKPQSSQFNQTQTEENREAEPLASTSTDHMKTEPDGEDCGVSEPASNLDPAGDIEPTRDGQLLSSDCSGTETDDSDEWEETGEPQLGLNTLKSKKTQKNKGQSLCISNKFNSSVGSSHEVKLSNQILSETWSCKVCGKYFPSRNSLVNHIKVHPSDCGLCGKHLEPTESLKHHLQTHRTCTVCGKKCTTGTSFERHMRSHTGEKPFSCTLCHKRFVEKRNLTEHLRSHTGEKPFKCTLCNKTFGYKTAVNRHLRVHTGERSYSCTLCQKFFLRKGNLDRHLRSHTGEKPFCCTVCGKGFTRKGCMKRHMRLHTGESCLSLPLDPSQLSVCEEEVPPEQQERSPSLGQEEPEPLHIKEEQEELWTSKEGEQLQGLEEADIIKFTFNPVPVKSEHDEEKSQSSWFNQTQTEENREAEPLASTLTEQMKTELDGDDCGVSEPASNIDPAGDLEPTRDVHLLSSDYSGTETDDSDEWEETGDPQSGLNTLKSKKTEKNKGQSLCISNKFKSSVGSSHEVKLTSQILSETWSCKVCGKCFPCRRSLMHHNRVHLSDCGLCGKHLEPTESLKLHLKTHWTCTLCGKKCTTATYLDRHMISHTGEKPYSCTLCLKRFGYRQQLDIHLRSHSGETSYSCTLCLKRFVHKGHFNLHLRSHTGDKTFSCKVCGKTFSERAQVRPHMSIHTGEKPSKVEREQKCSDRVKVLLHDLHFT